MPKVVKSDASDILVSYLKKHGITQHFVATSIGMSDQQLTNMIKGRTDFSAEKALMIAKALEVPSSIFLEESYT
jgi:plasmid maintenance system antidote protein VapI